MKHLLLPTVGLMIASWSASYGQQVHDDNAYCAELSSIYRRYVQNSPGRQFDAEAAFALENCRKGNAAAAIPILEKKLQSSGFSLPKEFKP